MPLVNPKPNTFETRVAITVSGICTSIIGFNYFDGWLIYLPYAIVLLIGYLSVTQKNALINGMLFGAGHYVTYFLMIGGYSYYLHIITFAVLFALLGSLLGVAIAYIGYSIKAVTRKKS
jgi:hypothetical protein